jgi:hypothetical protein
MPTVTVGETIGKKEIGQLISFNLLHDVTSKQENSLTTKICTNKLLNKLSKQTQRFCFQTDNDKHLIQLPTPTTLHDKLYCTVLMCSLQLGLLISPIYTLAHVQNWHHSQHCKEHQ